MKKIPMVLKWPGKWFIYILFLFFLQSTGLLLILTYNFYHNLQPNDIDKQFKNQPRFNVFELNSRNSIEDYINKSSNDAQKNEASNIKAFRLLKALWAQVTSKYFTHKHQLKHFKSKFFEKQEAKFANHYLTNLTLELNTSLKNCSMLVDHLKEGSYSVFFSNLFHYLWSQHPSKLPLCPLKSPHLKGRISVRRFLNRGKEENMEEVGEMGEGGVWQPKDCRESERMVLIVPYRNRKEHLEWFLPYIHRFMQRQLVDYRVIVVEQQGQADFNRGALMNIGFQVAQSLQKVDCAIFHDVDLLPEHDYNFYRCGPMPRHMSVSVSSFGYKLPYRNIFGGVEMFRSDQFKRVNGFSNLYFGWGGEDDDLFKRVYLNGLQIIRYPAEIATYTMLEHPKQTINPRRFDLLRSSTYRQGREGLSTTPLLSCLNITLKPLFTHIRVSLDQFYYENMKPFSLNPFKALFS